MQGNGRGVVEWDWREKREETRRRLKDLKINRDGERLIVFIAERE